MRTIRNNNIAFVHHHTYFWERFGARIVSDRTLRILCLQKSDFCLQKVSPLGRVILVGPYGCPAPERDVWSRIGMRLGSTTRENRFCPISGLPDFQFTIKKIPTLKSKIPSRDLFLGVHRHQISFAIQYNGFLFETLGLE